MATVDSNVMEGYCATKVPITEESADAETKAEDSPTARRSKKSLQSENSAADEASKPLHRIREVRLQQGVSLRSAARNTGLDVRTLRAQEQPEADLRLSDLWRWQQALDVPMVDLLEEGDAPLSRPVMERARLLRLMKTAEAIHQRC